MSARIPAVHKAENPIAARLHGKMKLPGHMRALRHGFYKLVRQILGMAGHKAYAVYSLYLIQTAQKPGKRNLAPDVYKRQPQPSSVSQYPLLSSLLY